MLADDWGLIVKNCTSFTAYRLSSVNGFNILVRTEMAVNGDIGQEEKDIG